MRIFNEGLFERFTQDAFLQVQENFSTSQFQKTVLQMSEEKSRADEFDFGVQYHRTYMSALVTKLNQSVERLNNIYTNMLESLTHRRVKGDGTHDQIDPLSDGDGGNLDRSGLTILDKDENVYSYGYNPYFGSRAINQHDDTLVRVDYVDVNDPVDTVVTDWGQQVGSSAMKENFALSAGYSVPETGWMWRDDGDHVTRDPVYFNRTFRLPSIPTAPVQVRMAADDLADVYLNGVQVNPTQVRWDGANNGGNNIYTFSIPAASFKAGDNLFVIKWQESGGGTAPDAVNFRANFPDGRVITTYEYPETMTEINEPYTDSNGDGSWTDGELFTDLNEDGVWDSGEPYTDTDGNGVFSAAEWFNDVDGDGNWDDAEPYNDLNGSGIYDLGEPYTDTDGNGVRQQWNDTYNDNNTNGFFDGGDTLIIDYNGDGGWDPAEPYTDSNLNGWWDPDDTYTDSNGNNQWDNYEAYNDTNQNGTWNDDEPYTDVNGNGSYDAVEPYDDANSNGVYDAPEAYTDTNGNGQYDGADGELGPDDTFDDINGNGIFDGQTLQEQTSWSWTTTDIITNPPTTTVQMQAAPAYRENGSMWSAINYLYKWDIDRFNAGYRSGYNETGEAYDPDDMVMVNVTALQPNRPVSPILKVGDRIPLFDLGGIRPGGTGYANGDGYSFDDSNLEAIVTSVFTNPDGTTTPNGWKIVYEGQGNSDPNDLTGVPMITSAPKEITKETISESFNFSTFGASGWTASPGAASSTEDVGGNTNGVWPRDIDGQDNDRAGTFSKNLDFTSAGTILRKDTLEMGEMEMEMIISGDVEVRMFNDTGTPELPDLTGGATDGRFFSTLANKRISTHNAATTTTTTAIFDNTLLDKNDNLVELFVGDFPACSAEEDHSFFRLEDLQLKARFITDTWNTTPRYTIDAYGNIFDRFGDGFQENGAFYVDTSQVSNSNTNYETPAFDNNFDTDDDNGLWDYVPDFDNPMQVGSFSSNFLYYKENYDGNPRYAAFTGADPDGDSSNGNPNVAILPVLNFDGRETNRFGELASAGRVVIGNPLAPAFGQVVMGYVEQDPATYQQALLESQFENVAFWEGIQDGVDIVGRSSEVGQTTEFGVNSAVSDAVLTLNLFNKKTTYDAFHQQTVENDDPKQITNIKITVDGGQPIPENEQQIYDTDWATTDADGTLGNTNLADDWAIVIKEKYNQLVLDMSSGALPAYNPTVADVDRAAAGDQSDWFYAEDQGGGSLWFPYVAGTAFDEAGTSYQQMTCDFRKSFSLTQAEYDALPAQVFVDVVTDNDGYLIVNGQQVGGVIEWAGGASVSVDIKPYLMVGTNIIGAQVTEDYGGEQFKLTPGAGMPAAMGSTLTTVGGNNWQSRVVPAKTMDADPLPERVIAAPPSTDETVAWTMNDQNEVQRLIQKGVYTITDQKELELYVDRSMTMSAGAAIQIEVTYDSGPSDIIGSVGRTVLGGSPDAGFDYDYRNYLVVGTGRTGGSYDNPLALELKRLTEDPDFADILRHDLMDNVYLTAAANDTYNDSLFGKIALTWEYDKRRIQVRQLSFLATWHS